MRGKIWPAMALMLWFVSAASGSAAELLDGKAFRGMIGPVENPDLQDNLFFEDGHFWSEICKRCGFEPGVYSARQTADGVAFTGVLESETRGSFAYDGLVRADGAIQVSIQWERRRWYWTSRREIKFIGELSNAAPAPLAAVRDEIERTDPDENPACARF